MKTYQFVPNGLYVPGLIEYAYILLEIGPGDVLISSSGDNMYPVAFSCDLLI